MAALGKVFYQVGDDIVKGTSQWKGIRVTVKLTIQLLGVLKICRKSYSEVGICGNDLECIYHIHHICFQVFFLLPTFWQHLNLHLVQLFVALRSSLHSNGISTQEPPSQSGCGAKCHQPHYQGLEGTLARSSAAKRPPGFGILSASIGCPKDRKKTKNIKHSGNLTKNVSLLAFFLGRGRVYEYNIVQCICNPNIACFCFSARSCEVFAANHCKPMVFQHV